MRWKIALGLLILFGSVQVNFARESGKKIKITGTVVNSNMTPVEGVFIFVDSIKTNVITDSRGRYHVRVNPAAKKILAVSLFDGVKEMDINGKNIVNFIFDGSSNKTNEPLYKESEMVDVGYGKIRKDDLSTSVSRIEGQKNRYKSYSNIFDMIAGEVPGVSVKGNIIRIRGISSNRDTAPLFVLDGIVIDRIDDVNPSQVKSIEILKDASSSIYGSRGANGVILITTTRGGDKLICIDLTNRYYLQPENKE